MKRRGLLAGARGPTLAAAIALAATAAGRAGLEARPADPERETFVPRPEVARIASLGYEALFADLYWMQAVQILGGALDPYRHATVLGRLVDVVTTLDPHVLHPYHFAAIWLVDSLENLDLANRLLERGIEYHPDDWRMRFYLAFNHYYYLGEQERGAEILSTAIGLEGAPLYLGRLVARLRSGGRDLDVAADFLGTLIESTEDPYARAEYEKALDEIETERRARFLDAAREEFQRRRGRDITRVEELTEPPDPVLAELPPEIHGWEWVLDPKTGRIVSNWYNGRYELHIHAREQAHRDRMIEEHRRRESRRGREL